MFDYLPHRCFDKLNVLYFWNMGIINVATSSPGGFLLILHQRLNCCQRLFIHLFYCLGPTVSPNWPRGDRNILVCTYLDKKNRNLPIRRCFKRSCLIFLTLLIALKTFKNVYSGQYVNVLLRIIVSCKILSLVGTLFFFLNVLAVRWQIIPFVFLPL